MYCFISGGWKPKVKVSVGGGWFLLRSLSLFGFVFRKFPPHSVLIWPLLYASIPDIFAPSFKVTSPIDESFI
jgi:hypothetical protein